MARPLRLLPLLLLLVAALAFPGAASAQPPRDPIDLSQVSEALLRDAGQYASTMGVSLEEAVYRLLLQQDIGELNAKLVESEPGTFAGMWIEHQPQYRVVAAFTRDGEATIRPYIEGGPLAAVVDILTAEATLAELKVAREEAASLAESVGVPASSAVDVTANTAQLYVLDASACEAALRRAGAHLPPHVQVVTVDDLPTPVTDVYGGLQLFTCTSGFSVRDAGGNLGIATAGHCRNDQTFQGVPLTFVTGTPDNNHTGYDIQWHLAPGFTVRNLMFDGLGTRSITAVEPRSAQTVGEWVYKYGVVTGYAGGPIVLTYYDGVNVALRVAVLEGDSGGPWFVGSTAYGTTISICTFGDGGTGAIYGPTDQMGEILGLSVLTY